MLFRWLNLIIKKILLSLIIVLSLIVSFNYISNTFFITSDRRIITYIADELVDQTDSFIDSVDNYIKSESEEDLKKAETEQTKLLTAIGAIETFTPENYDITPRVNWIKRENQDLESSLANLLNNSDNKEIYKNLKKECINIAINMSENAKGIDKDLRHNNTLWVSLWVICLVIYICKKFNINLTCALI